MRNSIKYISILITFLFSELVLACKCIELDPNEIFASDYLVFIVETDGKIIEKENIKYISGVVTEALKGDFSPGQNILIDYFADSSCEGGHGMKAKLLIIAGRGEHGYPTTNVCAMRAVEPFLIEGELAKPSDKNMTLLNQLRELTHNQSLHSDATKARR